MSEEMPVAEIDEMSDEEFKEEFKEIERLRKRIDSNDYSNVFDFLYDVVRYARLCEELTFRSYRRRQLCVALRV
jgi:hypothetical protein